MSSFFPNLKRASVPWPLDPYQSQLCPKAVANRRPRRRPLGQGRREAEAAEAPTAERADRTNPRNKSAKKTNKLKCQKNIPPGAHLTKMYAKIQILMEL